MPWTGAEFAARHNHSLHGPDAAKAASMANAMLRNGVPEGIAIATANKHAHHAIGGISHADPLGELAKPHPVKLLSTHGIGGHGGMGAPHQNASMDSPWWERSEAHQMSRGVGHYAAGGSLPSAETNPWFERSEARTINDMPHGGGLIGGSGAGRTDRLPLSVPSESHVVTADAMSGMGQGNTASGARNLLAALRIGPYGVPVPQMVHGHGPPHPPPAPHDTGLAHGGHSGHTSILAASGEFVIPPEDWPAKDEQDGKWYLHRGVRSLGGGDLKKGHQVIDRMMGNVREFNRKWLAHAPSPKK